MPSPHASSFPHAGVHAGLLLLCLGLAGALPAAPVIGAVTKNADPVPCYGKFEVTFPLTTAATNLYDPAQVDVHCLFSGPSGQTFTINGFAYQDYTRGGGTGGMTLNPNGGVVWKVRFSAPVPGAWTYSVTAVDGGGTSTAPGGSFQVSTSASHGFVQVSPVDPHYFAYSDGTAFFPVGENMDWPSESFDDNTFWYNKFLPLLSAQGGNWIRVWMSNWCFGLEVKGPKHGSSALGSYDPAEAWLLDNLFGQLEQRNMVAQLCLNYANQYTSTYADWTNNPYNAANGGPLANPNDLWTNATAQQYMTRRWRYITARWGYSTSLLDYELFNEVDHVDNSATDLASGVVAAWHSANKAVLAASNPQTHPVSTSFDAYIANQSSTWANLDFTQWHQYGNYPTVTQSETAMVQQYLPIFRGYRSAPDYCGEMGTSWQNPTLEGTDDPNGVAIHEVNWASLMGGAAGGGFVWWWDNYVDPNNLYPVWKGIAAFVAGEDLDRRAYAPATGTPSNANGQPLTTLYLQGAQKVLGWVQDQNNQWAAKLGGATVGSVPAATQSLSGLSPDGGWQVQWWDTVAGTVSLTQPVTVAGGACTLTVPAIGAGHPDWAFKLLPAPVVASTWRINAGGPAFTDSQGAVWSADTQFVGGSTAAVTQTVAGALPGPGDQAPYQSQRYGKTFDYSFNVPAGSYQVTLKFAETYWASAGQRIFNVYLNGTEVLSNFDIVASAGGANKALDEVFNNIAPSGGAITIQFGPASVDHAQVEAIQVIPEPAATATPTPSPTRSPSATHSPSPSRTASLAKAVLRSAAAPICLPAPVPAETNETPG